MLIIGIDATLNADTLVIAVSSMVNVFDPHRAASRVEVQIQSAIFEGLTIYDPRSLAAIPAGATAWEISEDGRRLTLFLRTEARFDTGDPVLATDVKMSWLRLLSPETDSPYAYLLDSVIGARDFREGRTIETKNVGIHVRADRVLEVEFAQPDPSFVKKLAHHGLVPIHESRRTATNDETVKSRQVVVGNGPFRYDANSTVGNLKFEINTEYWDNHRGTESSAITDIVVRKYAHPADASRDFNLGEIDWILGDFAPKILSAFESTVIASRFATSLLYIKSADTPWSNERIRRAIVSLLPIEELRSDRFHFRRANSLVPLLEGYPVVPAFDASGRREAFRLLSEAGFPNGDGLPELRIQVPDDAEGTRIYDVIAESLQSSINIDVRKSDKDSRGDVTIRFMTLSGDYPDPVALLHWLANNYAAQETPMGTYVTLLESARNSSGLRRYEFLASAEKLLIESMIIIPLYRETSVHAIRTDRINGWYDNVLDIHPIKFLFFAPPKIDPGVALILDRKTASTQTSR